MAENLTHAVPQSAMQAVGGESQGAAKPGLFTRLGATLAPGRRLNAFIDARQRAAEVKVARYLACSRADRLSDNIERDISKLL